MSDIISTQVQALSTDALVELYSLDLTNLTDNNGHPGSVYYWTPGTLPQFYNGIVLAVNPFFMFLDQLITPSPGDVWSISTFPPYPSTTPFFTNVSVLSFGTWTTNGHTYSMVQIPFQSNIPGPIGSIYSLQGGAGAVSFNGIVYNPYPITVTNYERSGQGKLPMPKLQIDNTILVPGGTVPLASSLIGNYSDVLGAIVTRTRTFKSCLDGQENEGQDAIFAPDIYLVDRKSAHNKNIIEFELAAAIDQMGKKLPGRQIIANICPWQYRQWNGSEFVNSLPSGGYVCPYVGQTGNSIPFGPFFDALGNPQTNPALDLCGKKFSDCLLRFPYGTPMPFGGFPGSSLVTF